MKNSKACLVGVVVVKWLIVAHQHHPNTHHQVIPKNGTLITLVLAFPHMKSLHKEGKCDCVSEETAKTVIEE